MTMGMKDPWAWGWSFFQTTLEELPKMLPKGKKRK